MRQFAFGPDGRLVIAYVGEPAPDQRFSMARFHAKHAVAFARFGNVRDARGAARLAAHCYFKVVS